MTTITDVKKFQYFIYHTGLPEWLQEPQGPRFLLTWCSAIPRMLLQCWGPWWWLQPAWWRKGEGASNPPHRVYHLDVGHLHELELSGSIITPARQSRKGFYSQKLCVLQIQESCFWEGKNGFEGQLIISTIVQSFGSAIPPLSKVDNPSPNHLCLEAKAKITFGWSVVFSISSVWLLV